MRGIGMPLLLLALGTALTAALSGCARGAAPLSAGPPGSGQCLYARPGHGVTYGLETFTNHSSATVILDRVGLRESRTSHNLKVLGASAVPGRLAVGAWGMWPPKLTGSGLGPWRREWAQRHRLSGNRLRPGATAGIVLGIESTAPPGGRTPGMLIWYHTADGSYLLRDNLEIIVGRCAGG